MKLVLVLSALLAIEGCGQKPAAPAPKAKTAYELLQSDEFWMFVTADMFLDGGSVTLSFFGRDGEVIHLWVDDEFVTGHSPNFQLGERRELPRKFFLKLTYNDPNAVEILPGSPEEKRVFKLLETCILKNRQFTALPKLCADMLRDRHASPVSGWPSVPGALPGD